MPIQTPPAATDWFAQSAQHVADHFGTNPDRDLSAAPAHDALLRLAPNSLSRDKPPSLARVALGQLRDPMTLMLVAVTAVSFVVAQPSTARVVMALIALNVILMTTQGMTQMAHVSRGLGRQQVAPHEPERGPALDPARAAIGGAVDARERRAWSNRPYRSPWASW